MAKKTTALAERPTPVKPAAAQALLSGDLKGLSDEGRLQHYLEVCQSLGLNPATQPFRYLELGEGANKRLVLYATKDCTDQMRAINRISVEIVKEVKVGDVYKVSAKASMPDGRCDIDVGVVPLTREGGEWKTAQSGKRYFAGNGQFSPLKPDDMANAVMKATTKAKRRVTLSICGLGFLDESELETMAHAQPVQVEVLQPQAEMTTGELSDPQRQKIDQLIRDGGVDPQTFADFWEVDTPEALHAKHYMRAHEMLTAIKANACITAKEWEYLKGLLEESKADQTAFCEEFDTPSPWQLLAANFMRAVVLLRRKIALQKEKAAGATQKKGAA